MLPNIIKDLNSRRRGLKYMWRYSHKDGATHAEMLGQVEGVTRDLIYWRHTVDLQERTCTCRHWQVTGLSCTHTLCIITSTLGYNIEDYVNEYYSIAKFNKAYGKSWSQWQIENNGLKWTLGSSCGPHSKTGSWLTKGEKVQISCRSGQWKENHKMQKVQTTWTYGKNLQWICLWFWFTTTCPSKAKEKERQEKYHYSAIMCWWSTTMSPITCGTIVSFHLKFYEFSPNYSMIIT